MKWREEGDMSVMPRVMVIPQFTPRIMDKLLPLNFKTPTVKKFEGAGDSQEDIMNY